MVWQIVSYIAAVMTTISFIPQIVRIIKFKNTRDISLLMYIVFFIGVVCWLAYGIYKLDIAIILANGITALLASVILTYKVVNVIRGEKM